MHTLCFGSIPVAVKIMPKSGFPSFRELVSIKSDEQFVDFKPRSRLLPFQPQFYQNSDAEASECSPSINPSTLFNNKLNHT